MKLRARDETRHGEHDKDDHNYRKTHLGRSSRLKERESEGQIPARIRRARAVDLAADLDPAGRVAGRLG
jgi:hypothetical protein